MTDERIIFESEHVSCIETTSETASVIPNDIEWHLRYGNPDTIIEQRLVIASIISQYTHLIADDIPQKTAFEMLKRSRRAYKIARGREPAVAGLDKETEE